MSSQLRIITATFSGAAESDEINMDNRTPVALISKSSFVGTTLQGKFSLTVGGDKHIAYDDVGNVLCKIAAATELQAGSLFILEIPDWVAGNYMTLLSDTTETTTVTVVVGDVMA